MAKAKVNTGDAVKEINTLIDSFNKLLATTNNVGQSSAANFRKVETALKELGSVSNKIDAEFAKLNIQYKNMTTSQRNFVTQTRNLKEEKNRLNSVLDRQSAELEKLKARQASVNGGWKGMLTGVSSLIQAFGIIGGMQLFGALVKDAYSLMKQFDGLHFALERITQDAFDAAVSKRFLTDITSKFGVELVTTAQRWIKFLAAAKQAGVTLKDTEDIFRSVTKAAGVLGLGTEELSSVYLALEQMMSKGKVTTEELRRQLGERLPGAVGIMAAAVGVNVNQLDKMLKKGEILSAEALPKFAKALELAYGIKNVESIDTITAAQNRLTNAWENFVKNMSENNDTVKNVLNMLGTGFEKVVNLFSSNEQKLQNLTLEKKNKFEKQLLGIATRALDAKRAVGEKYADIEAKIEADRQALTDAKDKNISSKQLAILEDNLRKNIAIQLKNDAIVTDVQKQLANKNIEDIKSRLNKEQDFIKNSYKKLNDSVEPMTKSQIKRTFDEIAASKNKVASLNAQLEVYRKLREVSKVTNSEANKDEDKVKKGPANYELKDVKNLDNEIKIATLRAQKEINDDLIAGEKINFEEKIRLTQENALSELEIAKAAQKEYNDNAKIFYDKQLDDLADAKREGRKIEGDESEWRKNLDKELADRRILSQIEYNKKEADVKTKQVSEIKKLMKAAEAEQVDISQDLYNKQIIAAREEYQASKKTVEDKKKLEKEYTRIAIESGNARLDILIKNAEALLLLEDLSETEINNLKRLINDLKAGFKDIVPEDTVKDTKKKFQDLMELIEDGLNALGDFGGAIFDRRLENINAEIDAEKKKYDTLIELAKGNKSEQERLEAEKLLKMEALEKRRLKEEQKKAKFEKVMALSTIAINTAIAVSKVAAQTGIFAPAGIGWIIALGAMQAAAVLAAPIPKYADGLDEADEDHVAMINDGGKKEFVERDGKILSTDTKNAIVQLKKGDTVHKDYESMIKSNDLFENISKASILTSLQSQSNNDFRKLEEIFDSNLKSLNAGMKKGIKEGFKNVTINNSTTYNAEWIMYKNDTL